ncbi:hydrogenase formation protein HypD (plasmid) [Pandoraea vervacti]|uniref:Hydrogenase maturation factor n=1 Tax=Pandoraea vervacti TaxID=656178 RepID=A0ABM6FRW7_9BURK|nr:hydrogenase formation protein HypD [Pandoraea vervacti]APD11543.1 hydrogenase formation protein HypD [Pandoraea vervacti]
MKHLDAWRDMEAAQSYARAIAAITTRAWTIMEICGSQTHSIVRYGIDRMMPDGVTLLHGPGCPVCVTPAAIIDAAIAIAKRREVTLCSFGDMLRVPGEHGSLLNARAAGADVRFVYSPLDALRIARNEPHRCVVFLAIGFETTAPATAMAVLQAEREGLENFFLLVAHVRVPPALEAILSDAASGVQGILAAGHVCTVMGYREYEAIAQRFHVPVVVTGFEPIDLLQGIYLCIKQLETRRAEVENPYYRAVHPEGNRAAQAAMMKVFAVRARAWRGLGEIAESGLGFAPAYHRFDALARFTSGIMPADCPTECIAAELLRARKRPADCPAFGTRCTPEHPLGPTMVSSEGVCAAYYRYRRTQTVRERSTVSAPNGGEQGAV